MKKILFGLILFSFISGCVGINAISRLTPDEQAWVQTERARLNVYRKQIVEYDRLVICDETVTAICYEQILVELAFNLTGDIDRRFDEMERPTIFERDTAYDMKVIQQALYTLTTFLAKRKILEEIAP